MEEFRSLLFSSPGSSLFVSSLTLLTINKWFQSFHQPRYRYHQQTLSTKSLQGMIENCRHLTTYIPPPLLDWWGHVHTILNHIIRQKKTILHSAIRELLQLEDGGTVALDWLTQRPEEDSTKPIVILIHGLCGNRESNHIVYAGHALQAKGYDVVAFIARGCGGLQLTTPESFTAARTSDLQFAIKHIRARYPNRDVFAIGYSLGAGILLKYLGQTGENSLVSAAVAVSPSWNFLISTPVFEFWSRLRLVEGLREYLLDHISYLRSHPSNLIKIDETVKAASVREFDHYAVVPAHGYRDVDHYYFDASAINHSKGIVTPTLALSADDDPVCAVEGCPWDDMEHFGPGLVVARTRTGGHVAFSTYELLCGKTTSWMDLVAVDWFEAYQRQQSRKHSH